MTVDLLRYFAARHDQLLSSARALVERESPTRDAAAAAALIARDPRPARWRGRRHPPGRDRERSAPAGPFRRLTARPRRRPVMLLGHVDTVWPRGTLRQRPFRVEDGRAYGPGVFDMKSGVAVMLAALEAIGELDLPRPHPLKVLLSCDEESGSATSRDLIQAEAGGARRCCVLEPPLPGGRAKTERKGVARYELIARGVSAHAGSRAGARQPAPSPSWPIRCSRCTDSTISTASTSTSA